MYCQGSRYATVWAWLGTSWNMRAPRPLTPFLPVILQSWTCLQKHSCTFLMTSSPSINLKCPKSGIMLKWASIPQSSFFSPPDTATLPFFYNFDLVANEMNQCHEINRYHLVMETENQLQISFQTTQNFLRTSDMWERFSILLERSL